MMADTISTLDVTTGVTDTQTTDSGEIYAVYVGFHIVLFIIALIWRWKRGAPKIATS